MARRSYAGGAAALTLSSGINATATSISTTGTATGWPDGSGGKFLVCIDRGLSTEEKLLALSRTGNTLTLSSSADRGADNTTGASHASGAIVEHCLGAIDLDEANRHINTTGDDNHTQYLNTTRHDLTARHMFLPWGTLGYAAVTANQLGISTETDLSGLTATVTVGAGRRIKITAHCIVSASAGNIEHQLDVKEGATYLQVNILLSTASNYVSHHCEVVLTPSAGAHTYKLSLLATSGTVGLRADATTPAFILVEDIGT